MLNRIFIVLISIQTATLHANENEARKVEICKQYKSSLPPPTDLVVGQKEREALKNCSSEDLYFGFGIPKNYTAARQCAILEIESKAGQVFGGQGMLMMIYANAAGVQRNFDIALHFACQIEGLAPAELEGYVSALKEYKATNWSGTDFHLCQYITSGNMMGHCAEHTSKQENLDRDTRHKKIAEKVPAKLLTLFNDLNSAADAFIEARIQNEVDLSGTARGMFVIEERNLLREDYIQMLEMFEKGTENRYKASENPIRIEKLKTVLADIHNRGLQNKTFGTITASNIEKTQSAWIAYRDAFAKYAAARYPRVKEGSVNTWLTIKRTAMLRNLTRYPW